MDTGPRYTGPISSGFSSFSAWALSQAFRTPNRLAYSITRNPGSTYSSSPLGSGPAPAYLGATNLNAGADYNWPLTSHSHYITGKPFEVASWWKKVLEYVK